MPKPRRITAKAPAKVNLSLKVGALDTDGFHPVETVYQAVDLYDEIVATHSDTLSITCEGEGAELAGSGPGNLAWRAAELLAKHAGIEPHVHLHITKRIPVAGGMAGGSADAAGALVACDALWQLETSREDLLSLASQLGSDIPFSVAGGTALGRGRGDVLTTMLARGEFHWVFALANEGLSTPSVYKEFDLIHPDAPDPVVSAELVSAIASGDIRTAAKHLENDLQVPAIRLRHSLNSTLRAGREAGALAAIVSGSGPTCAFLARNAEHAIELAIELQASGAVQRTVRAAGPVRGAHVVSVE